MLKKKLWKKNSTEWLLPPCLPPTSPFETEQSRPYISLGVKLPAGNTPTHWHWCWQNDVSTNRNSPQEESILWKAKQKMHQEACAVPWYTINMFLVQKEFQLSNESLWGQAWYLLAKETWSPGDQSANVALILPSLGLPFWSPWFGCTKTP